MNPRLSKYEARVVITLSSLSVFLLTFLLWKQLAQEITSNEVTYLISNLKKSTRNFLKGLVKGGGNVIGSSGVGFKHAVVGIEFS
jgi:hypothetical protein